VADAAFRFLVRGTVQGVGFRRSAQLEAYRLGVRGWVRNTPAGDVEGVAEGAPAALEAFAAWLSHGPRLARVEAVDRHPQASAGEEGFRVR
jgi:acylphosphatase